MIVFAVRGSAYIVVMAVQQGRKDIHLDIETKSKGLDKVGSLLNGTLVRRVLRGLNRSDESHISSRSSKGGLQTVEASGRPSRKSLNQKSAFAMAQTSFLEPSEWLRSIPCPVRSFRTTLITRMTRP